MIDSLWERRADVARNEDAHPNDDRVDNPTVVRTRTDESSAPRGSNKFSGDDGAPPVFRGELRLALDFAARWLWRDGRPRMVIRRRREIVWCNPAARRLLAAPAPLVIRHDMLCPAAGVDIDPVDGFLDRLGSASSRFQVMDTETDRGVLLTAWADLIDGEQAAFIEFGLRELPFDCRDSGMAEAFGLTKAECRIVDALAVMEAPSKIAERLEVSVHTVRTHIRRIYTKLKVRSQLQFMRLTMAYCAG